MGGRGSRRPRDGHLHDGLVAPVRLRRGAQHPIGIDQADWWQDAEGRTLTYCCLDTTSRAFARFGQLYLNQGWWGWVAASLTPSSSFEGYGYKWWLTGRTDDELPDDLVSARGHDGQFIYVVPSLDLVVVRASRYFEHDGPAVADPNLFEKYPNSLVPRRSTDGSEIGWDDARFLLPILESIHD